jgi:predicted 3-demethylubiquinone-9 3-methyltransferase (glyoxalase superfamily)
MTKIAPFLMFVGEQHGKAEEAMKLYVSVFKRSRILQVERFGPDEEGPENSVKHAIFLLDGQEVMAMDGAGPHPFTFTPAVSLFAQFENGEELDSAFAKLSEGGSVLMPLDNYPFAERFAWVADKYGVSWQLYLARR